MQRVKSTRCNVNLFDKTKHDYRMLITCYLRQITEAACSFVMNQNYMHPIQIHPNLYLTLCFQ